MRIDIPLAAVAASMLVACSTVPPLIPETALPLQIVIDQIQCELKAAAITEMAIHSYLQKWAASYTLTLRVNDSLGVTPSVSLTGPFSTGTFTLGLGAGVSGSRDRIAKFQFTFPLVKMIKFQECSGTYAGGHPFLSGNLGIAEWLHRSLHAFEPNDIAQEPDSVGQSIQFAIQYQASLTPAFKFVRVSSSEGITGQRTDTNTLDVSFAAPKPAARGLVAGAPGGAPAAAQQMNQMLLLERIFVRPPGF